MSEQEIKKIKAFIPKGYHWRAETQLRHTKAICYYNRETDKYYVVVDDELPVGPFNKLQIEAMIHVLYDATDIRKM